MPSPGLRALDAWHLDRSTELRAAFYAEARLGPNLHRTDHRREVASLVDASAGMVITGGHVGVLLHLLHVFGLPAAPLIRPPVITWSAGAMALSPRVVLFGDYAPHGHHDAEFYAAGLGLYHQCVPFPHARRRLRIADSSIVGSCSPTGSPLTPESSSTTAYGWTCVTGRLPLPAVLLAEPS